MPRSGQLKKQLIKMWNENPSCHWCGRLTRLEGRFEKPLAPDAATLDHLYSRLNPLRRTVNRTMEKRRLLACNECNQRLCREEVAIHETARKVTEAERRKKYIFSSDDPRLPKGSRIASLVTEQKNKEEHFSKNDLLIGSNAYE